MPAHRSLILLFIALAPVAVHAQTALLDSTTFFARLQIKPAMPERILDGRSVVLYSPQLTQKDIGTCQKSFARTGLDAVAYFTFDRVFAGKEAIEHFADYFSKREISELVFILARDSTYTITITPFDGTTQLAASGQAAWQTQGQHLQDVLMDVYRTAAGSFQKKNFLINEAPETDLSISIISGRRMEAFAYDLKVDQLAVPRSTDSLENQQLREIFSEYPFKFKFVDPTTDEKELRRQGFLYVMHFVRSRGRAAKDLLGYTYGPSETAFASVTFPGKEPQVKNISVEQPVYKYYIKQIEAGNVFLGTKWDADVTWQQALRNYLRGMKWELRIN